MYILTKFCCNRSVAVKSQLVVDPQCKGVTLFIDLFFRRKGGEIVSDKIWCDLIYGEFSVLIVIYPGFFLMYAVSSFGEKLCNVVQLRMVNMMYGSNIFYYYRSVMML